MNKTLCSAAAIALALSAGSALAADLPSMQGPPEYYPPPPPPPILWTGFYAGLNAGYTWSENNRIATSAGVLTQSGFLPRAPVLTFGATAFLPTNSRGFIGGGQAGYNFQFGNRFVAGFEADIQGVAGTRSIASTASLIYAPGSAFPHLTALSASRRVDYLGTARGRLGFLVTPSLLAYATGGLAYGGVSSNASLAQGIALQAIVPPAFTTGAYSNTRVGWTVGGGGEWMFMPNLSAKIEYLYYDLGAVTHGVGGTAFFVTPCPCAGAGTDSIIAQARTRYNGHIVRAGLNYHFNWDAAPVPVYAKY